METEKYLARVLRYLSYRPRSEKEIRDFLAKKKLDVALQQKILTILKEQKLVDDEEFAKWWVEQRTVFRPKGVRLIKLELRQKGISQEIIESQISNIQFPISNERERARKLVEKRITRYKGLPKQEKYQKLQRFLAARGFDFDVISDILKDINNR